MKKITAKEFKEILAKADLDFEVFGYEGILNMISQACQVQADTAKSHGVDLCAAGWKRSADEIYYTLKEKGYYEY